MVDLCWFPIVFSFFCFVYRLSFVSHIVVLVHSESGLLCGAALPFFVCSRTSRSASWNSVSCILTTFFNGTGLDRRGLKNECIRFQYGTVPNWWPETSNIEIKHGLPLHVVTLPPSPDMAFDPENHVLRDELTHPGPLACCRFAKIIPMSNPWPLRGPSWSLTETEGLYRQNRRKHAQAQASTAGIWRPDTNRAWLVEKGMSW